MIDKTDPEILKNTILKRAYFNAPVHDLKNLQIRKTDCPCCLKAKNVFIVPPHREYELLCIDCLLTVDLNFAHNTEKGLVSKDPILFGQADDFDIRLHVSLESISKLQKTPNIQAAYDTPWLICCKDFMEFIGIWEASDFTRESETSGKELFLKMTNKDYSDLWDELDLDDNETEYTWTGIKYYSFHCTKCLVKRGNWEYLEEE